ncbi:DUF4347 domain-containing protein [Sulfurisoma sediminicola]|uniref:Putative delta-60 repeat protein n=1 Tax=Sulfurisoma sediminicola TaxID=1381557 RepID=A0A497XEK0_9PROT|nr:DUF4347 domain-containing protein [Sulfurisoma sediminicola]RLJ65139.1 putative delta-60 repeat protein [Sulfurisoma sediminicola]
MGKSIVFIDERVSDLQSLIEGFAPDTEWFLLRGDEDGVAQIARTLAKRSRLDSVHIVSHGSAGSLLLGNGTLDSDTLPAYQAAMSAIGASLATDGDILLYGCDVAQGSDGAAFLAQMAAFTGADIAASNNLTGGSTTGGDWVLESQVGAIESATLSASNYEATLVANTSPSFGIGDGKVTTAIGGGADGAYGVVVQPDGKIVVGGESYNGSNYDYAVVRYNADGSLDATFDGDGKLTTAVGAGDDFGRAGILMQPDGKLVVAGHASYDFALVRYNPDGSLDASFDGDGKVVTPVRNNDDAATDIALQADGKIVVAGLSWDDSFSSYDFAVVRYNGDGSLDTTFDTDGKVFTDFGYGYDAANGMVVQADGKIVAAGYASNGANLDIALVRYNTDGSLDGGFGTGGKVATAVGASNDSAESVTLQADGKILATGWTYTGAEYDLALVRYNTDGSLDTSFDTDGIVTTAVGSNASEACDVAVQGDGKILVGGYVHNGTNYDFLLARYNVDGSLDGGFGNTGKASVAVGPSNDQAYSIAVQSDGKIVVAGLASNGGNDDFAVVRFNADGSLDTGFDAVSTLNGVAAFVEGGPVVVLDPTVQIADAELAAMGDYAGANVTLTRQGGPNPEDTFSAVGNLGFTGGDAILSGVTIGTATNAGGTLMLTFNANATQARVDEALSSIAYSNSSGTPPASVQIGWTFSDGNTGAQGSGGPMSAIGSTTVNIAAIPNPNTAPSFGIGDGKVTTAIGSGADAGYRVALQPDGRIVVAGISHNGSNLDFALARYNADGSLDSTFDGDGMLTTAIGGGDDYGYGLTVQPDGRILVAGQSWNGSTYTDFALVRYNADGSLDTTFSGDGMLTTAVGWADDGGYDVTLQADGRILVAGAGWVGSNGDFALVRYNTDGSLDTSFDGDGMVTTAIGTYHDYGQSVTVQPDGKILVAGVSDSGNIYFALVRYNADGSLDTTFSGDGMLTTAIGAGDDRGASLALQADGRILVTGHSWNGSNSDFVLVRYNADGSLDTSFDGDGKLTTVIGAGDDGSNRLTLQPDGRILVAGISHNGSNYDLALVRYNTDGSLDTTFDGDGKLTTAIGAGDDWGYSVAVQPDGQILVAGASDNGSNSDFALVRYNPDGSLDTHFDSNFVSTLNVTASYITGSPAAVLDSNVQIYDAELAVAGNYGGASLRLSRSGGASPQDVFSAKPGGTLAALMSGGDLIVDGTAIGTVIANAGGSLELSFNGNATQSLLDSAVQQIAYSNIAGSPPPSVQIVWTFSDGNAGAQGTGGALSAFGRTSVQLNVVIGGIGDDTLDGRFGNATLVGGQGSDLYFVDNAYDRVVELPFEGTDAVQASVTYCLPQNVEDLVLTGSLAINGIGNRQNNHIVGNAASNCLFGDAGNDVIEAGPGDLVFGGAGRDEVQIRLSRMVDAIGSFEEEISLSRTSDGMVYIGLRRDGGFVNVLAEDSYTKTSGFLGGSFEPKAPVEGATETLRILDACGQDVYGAIDLRLGRAGGGFAGEPPTYAALAFGA